MIIYGYYFYDYEIKWATRGFIYLLSFIVFLIGLVHLSKKENRKIKFHEYFCLFCPMLNTIMALVYLITFISVTIIQFLNLFKNTIKKLLHH